MSGLGLAMRCAPALAALVFLGAPALAAGDCVCEGCGCKGGPGYRDQAGHCVGWKKLARTCGQPPTERCREEKAKQVCASQARHPHGTSVPPEATAPEASGPRPASPKSSTVSNPFGVRP